MELSFIIIDDTELDHFIAKKMIAYADKAISIQAFFDATLALEYMAADKEGDNGKITVVLLDIYMPLMNGFEFVEKFEELPQHIQNKYYIVALTSTREPYDINRVATHMAFKGMINKPITNENLADLLTKVSKDYDLGK